MTETQTQVWKLLLQAVETKPSRQIVYCSEWLGYLPYGVYCWIEVDGQDISAGFPSGWQLADLTSLEQAGLLKQIKAWQDPDDEYHQRITYEVSEVADLHHE